MLSNETTFISEPSENVPPLNLEIVDTSTYGWFEYGYFCAEKGGPSAWWKSKNVNIDIIIKEKLEPTKINEKKLKKTCNDDCKRLKKYFDEYSGGNIKLAFDRINKILAELYKCGFKELSENLTIKKLYEIALKALKQLYNLKLKELKNSNKAIVSFKKCLEEYTWIKYVSRSIKAKASNILENGSKKPTNGNITRVINAMDNVENFLKNYYRSYIDYYSIY